MMLHSKERDELYLWSNIVTVDSCWFWTGPMWGGSGEDGQSYGRTSRGRYAHRFSYEMAKGPIPAGMELDHLCRNRLCVNPDHLEPVTHRENILRGEHPTARAFRSGLCRNGHPLTVRPISKTGSRICLICHAARMRAFRIRRVAR